MASKNFTQFELRTPLLTGDYLVGYKEDGSEEFKTQVQDLINFSAFALSPDGTALILGNENFLEPLIDNGIILYGSSNTLSGSYGVVGGDSSVAGGNYSISLGFENAALGEKSIALGENSYAFGETSYAHGREVYATGDQSYAQGGYTYADHNHTWIWQGTTSYNPVGTTRDAQFIIFANEGGISLNGSVGINTDSLDNALTVVGNVSATENVYVGDSSPSPFENVILQLNSTTKGFLPPRMTRNQRNSITTPPSGLMIYNTTTNLVNYYTGNTWVALATATA